MKTVTFVCSDDPLIEHGVGDVKSIGGLCRLPGRLAEHDAEAERAMLLLHEDAFDLSQVQKALRTIEVDPLGAQILAVSPQMDPTDIHVATLGLQSRGAAFLGSRPEHAKPVLARAMTRRGLLLPSPEYLAVPMVDHGICAAGDGCRACVDVCPQDAYKRNQGRIQYNKDICEPCGRCVTTCPTAAISNPAVTPAMLKAQIMSLVDGADAPIGVRFVCSRRLDRATAPGWYDVEVPCTGMVPGTWLLASALMGAGSVTAVPCAVGECPQDLDRYALEAVDFAREALIRFDLDPEVVPVVAGQVAVPIIRMDLDDPFGLGGPVEALLALSSVTEQRPVFAHDGAGMGVVQIDPSACTLCTQCAQTCPTGALDHGYEGNTVSLTFDAAICTDCKQCTIVCPELAHGAIRVTGTVNAGLLKAGRETINEGAVLLCENCGQPIAPSQMMDRIGELLGNDFVDTMGYLTRRCIDCRGI